MDHHRADCSVHRRIVYPSQRPKIAAEVEDYVIFSIDSYTSAFGSAPWINGEAELARILRGERTPLSDQEIADAMSCRISFGREDAALIDWHAAVLFGKEMDDVRAVLEFANVELLEMRMLDEQLDRALDEGYEALTRKSGRTLALPGSFEQDTTHIAQLQVDAALLFERVTNTLKLLGDQYLARVDHSFNKDKDKLTFRWIAEYQKDEGGTSSSPAGRGA